jgi:hypothetical protein
MKRLVPAILLLVAAAAQHRACIQPPEGFKHYVDTGTQRGLVFFDNGREELVIQPAYLVSTIDMPAAEFTDEGMLKGLSSFAWVLPLPALPDSYAEVEPALFDDLAKFTETTARVPEPDRGNDAGDVVFGSGAALEFFAPIKAGAYEIQPLKARGEAGGKELSAWLSDNGFGALDERVTRYYLKAGYYWLAVRLKAPAGLPAEGSGKPLRISFKATRPVYPLKLYDKRGAFDLELWLITRHAVDLTKSRKFGIETAEQRDDRDQQQNRETSYIRLPESARTIADPSPELRELRIGKVFVYRFTGRNLDKEGGVDLGLLQDDLFFEFEKDVAPKPATEVKPTPEEEDKKTESGDKPKEEK